MDWEENTLSCPSAPMKSRGAETHWLASATSCAGATLVHPSPELQIPQRSLATAGAPSARVLDAMESRNPRPWLGFFLIPCTPCVWGPAIEMWKLAPLFPSLWQGHGTFDRQPLLSQSAIVAASMQTIAISAQNVVVHENYLANHTTTTPCC